MSAAPLADRPDFAARRARARSAVAGAGVAALLVTDLVNIRYLTGFTGSNAALYLDADSDEATVIGTDGRYLTQVAQQVPDLAAFIDRDTAPALLAARGPAAGGPIGFEAHVVTVAELRRFEQIDRITLTPTESIVEALRRVKDASEVAALQAACDIADDALAQLLAAGSIAPGRSERAVGRALDFAMLELGAEELSFETIVAAGVNSAVPHHRPSDYVLAVGDFVTLDFGAVVGGYHSDMTRTVVLGTAEPWQIDLYELVARAAAAGRALVRADTPVQAVDAAARSLIADAGHGEQFLHGLGHGVGLQVHEAPTVSARGTGTLLVGETVTVEPGVYLAGRGGVRIEDSLLVTGDDPRLLTHSPRELTELS